MKFMLFILGFFGFANVSTSAQTDTVSVPSERMKKMVKTVVITPSAYHEKGLRFPVIYLLHGLSDNYAKWVTEVPSIKNLADKYQVIIVCPDSDYGSFYLDSPVNPSSMYETFTARELVSWIDKNYKTIASSKGRAITGLSMGGHGAIYLAARNPGVFAAAGSMSGAVDLTHGIDKGESQKWVVTELTKVLGPYQKNEHIWLDHSVLHMTAKIKESNFPFLVDCGNDDFLLESNREFHRRLVYEKISHEYLERPGSHNWEYWSNAIVYQFEFLNKYLKKK